ncbi:ABC transporter ATP-binding protein [Paenibacillus sp. TRM 82003]|uniref:ABC transporter ATP-binding protein n=1 Tax=Kineococcus sp. TRM81007 TaxID=2925831 RepID=UPI001F58C920|nr:ABC transporter ATP-binding protein [Kineococcus sp. TRM81007]MCI2237929.1 ABC transporter ATP-binding protein [Kineococcus sp. TRM81007]MCI3925942.1 ABC transporter ATP-binding protein [Paenibacillus sp. TRM 82003]
MPTNALAPTTAAVSLRAVSKTYGSGPTAVRAVDQVDLDLATGTWTAVMGPSGSGKSTLLNCAAGLERVDSGRVLLGGTDITDADDETLTRLRRTRVGFIFQSFNLVASLSAAQNVELPLRLAGKRPPRADVREALRAVGLAERADHRPRQLSGGQQQRVAIARALITRPQVLFADEPTGALDSSAARGVLDLLRAAADGGQSVVMVTHDPAAAARADATVLVRDGRVEDRVVGADAVTVAARLAAMGA